MKPFNNFKLLLLMLLSLIEFNAFAADIFTVDGIVYERIYSSYEDGYVASVTYDKDKYYHDDALHEYIGTTYSGSVIIPSSVVYNNTTYKVTHIGSDAFHGCQDLTSVVLPSSIKEIGIQAFRNCPNLITINLPEGLETIRFDAFTYDNGLTEIILPSSLKLIDGYAFCECRGLKRVILKDSDVSLQKPQAYGCYAIFSQISVDYAYIGRAGEDSPVTIDTKELVLGDAITYVSDASFNPSTLEKISIPASVTTIRNGAFLNATNLKEAIFEDGTEPISLGNAQKDPEYPNGNIYQSCFHNTSLEKLYLGRNLKSVNSTDNNGFYRVKTLKTAELGPNVTTLVDYQFLRCEGLVNIDFSKAPLTAISIGCFSDCYELTSAILPSSVTTIKERAFDSCKKLATIHIPYGVTEIGSNAFTANSCEEIRIPSTCETIGKEAFGYCRKLKKITLSEGLKTVSQNAFYDCESIEEVTIPSSVTTLGGGAFKGVTALRKIKIKDAEPYLNLDFSNYNSTGVFEGSCNSLEEIYIGRRLPSSIGTFSKPSLFAKPSPSTTDITSSPVITFGGGIDITTPYMFYSFSNVRKVICTSTYPIPFYEQNLFNVSTKAKIKVYVPQGYLEQYESYNWTGFASVQENIKPTRVSLTQTSANMSISETILLTATVYPSNAADKEVSWKSSNEAVATVDETGKVTAIGAGDATITVTVTAYDNISATCRVHVKIPVSEIKLNETTATLNTNQTLQLTTTVSPNNAENKTLSWTSSDESVASVDQSGMVTAISQGSAVITVSSTDGSDISATCNISVVRPVTAITLSENQIVMSAGEYHILTATVIPSNASNTAIVWSSSNEAIARVENGIVIAISDGEAIITAYANDGSGISATCQVIIRTLITEILLNENEISLKEGEFKEISATVLPDNATNAEVVWNSSDETIATVQNGLILAHKQGTAIIRVEATDGSGVYAECSVKVTSDAGIEVVNADGITISTKPLVVYIHGTNENTIIRLFDLNGSMLYFGSDSRIEVAQTGAYLLVINNNTYKIKL